MSIENNLPTIVKSIRIANLLKKFQHNFPELLDWIQFTLLSKYFFEYVKISDIWDEEDLDDDDKPIDCSTGKECCKY